MNTGIQILIERMKTNPEEWCKVETNTKMGRWESIVVLFWDYLPEEDQVAYKAARHALLADEFTEQVMKKLAGADDDGIALTSVSHNDVNPLTSKIRMQGRYASGLVDPYQNNPYQGMERYKTDAVGGAGGAGGDGILSNLAKNLGFK